MASFCLNKGQTRDLYEKVSKNFVLDELEIIDDNYVRYNGCEFFIKNIDVGFSYKYRVAQIRFAGNPNFIAVDRSLGNFPSMITVDGSIYRKRLSKFLFKQIKLKKQLMVEEDVQNFLPDSTQIFETLNNNPNG